MTLPILATIFGIFLLLYSADIFVDGASDTAKYFNIPSLLIGIVIIGFGTSMPELVVSFISGIERTPGIAIGNAYGSNIANIALILGTTALISPVIVNKSILKKELPILTFVTLVSLFLILDKNISRVDSIILLFLFLGFMSYLIFDGLKASKNIKENESLKKEKENISILKAILFVLIGLVLLVVSSKILVWGAVKIAASLGVSELVIGLTVVAVGTSLPELASSIVSARKNEHDLTFGNIIGSNIFNTLACVGIAGSIMPFSISKDIIFRDMGVLIFLTLILFLMGYNFKNKQGKISRFEGAFLLACYIAYTSILILKSIN
ncbi:MAG: calcium/sodium antiporter [Bdellovibrionota bacterium]|nr:calcium/sodium antiporter [Bdellovibrionota bacterium]